MFNVRPCLKVLLSAACLAEVRRVCISPTCKPTVPGIPGGPGGPWSPWWKDTAIETHYNKLFSASVSICKVSTQFLDIVFQCVRSVVKSHLLTIFPQLSLASFMTCMTLHENTEAAQQSAISFVMRDRCFIMSCCWDQVPWIQAFQAVQEDPEDRWPDTTNKTMMQSICMQRKTRPLKIYPP